VLVAVLAVIVTRHPGPTAIDHFVARRLGAADESTRYRVAADVSAFGSTKAVVAIAFLLAAASWWRTRSWRLTLLCILAPGLAGAAQWATKEIVRRSPPGNHVPGSALSFPSGHACGACALAATVIILAFVSVSQGWTRRAVIAIAAGYAVAVGTARVVVGDHYATDVIGGALLGGAIALGAGALLLTCADGTPPEHHRVAPLVGRYRRRGVARARR
jgi:membrane-associated phospholipid phosphatase